MKMYVIYADGFRQYELDNFENAQTKLTELITNEQKYKIQREWYMKTEEIDCDCQWK